MGWRQSIHVETTKTNNLQRREWACEASDSGTGWIWPKEWGGIPTDHSGVLALVMDVPFGIPEQASGPIAAVYEDRDVGNYIRTFGSTAGAAYAAHLAGAEEQSAIDLCNVVRTLQDQVARGEIVDWRITMRWV